MVRRRWAGGGGEEEGVREVRLPGDRLERWLLSWSGRRQCERSDMREGGGRGGGARCAGVGNIGRIVAVEDADEADEESSVNGEGGTLVLIPSSSPSCSETIVSSESWRAGRCESGMECGSLARWICFWRSLITGSVLCGSNGWQEMPFCKFRLAMREALRVALTAPHSRTRDIKSLSRYIAIAIFYPFRPCHPQPSPLPHTLSTLHSLPLPQVPLPP